MSKSDFFPCLPLRDIIVFPGMIVPLFVGRDKSIRSLNEVMKTNKKIILVTQKNAEIDDPGAEDLYSYGCESKILQLLKLPDGTVKVLIEGIDRVKITECIHDKEFLISNKCKPGYTILEVKFERGIPAWFHRTIQAYNLRRESISKFVYGICNQKIRNETSH